MANTEFRVGTPPKVFVPPPNVQLSGAALSSAKIKDVYGYTAFIELGLCFAQKEQAEVKYRIEDGRLIPMRARDWTYMTINVLGFVRTYYGAKHEDLNFMEVEIPKFIRWYLWNEETQVQACLFFEKIVLKGLEFLRDISYKDDKEVQPLISYWIKLVNMAVQKPVSETTFNASLNKFLLENRALNDKIIKTVGYLNEADTTFGKKIRQLVKIDDLQKVNNLFDRVYGKEKLEEIQYEINNSYMSYINQVWAATRQTVSVQELHHLEEDSHQISHSENPPLRSSKTKSTPAVEPEEEESEDGENTETQNTAQTTKTNQNSNNNTNS